ncbi:MAG: hypothetical protein ACRDVM_01555 [Acidimicrobiia bacterium]
MPEGSPLRRAARDLGTGLGAAGGAVYLVFFGTNGWAEVAVVALAAGCLVWAASVDPGRLVDDRRRRVAIFALGTLLLAIAVSAVIALQTATLLLAMLLLGVAWVTGMVRALGW